MPINEDQFLQMLMTELQNQNPMNRAERPDEFVTELAQFTSVEQETDTAQNTSTLASGQSTHRRWRCRRHRQLHRPNQWGDRHRHGAKRGDHLLGSDSDYQRHAGIAPSSVTEVS